MNVVNLKMEINSSFSLCSLFLLSLSSVKVLIMENDYLLVSWIKENPVRTSIMTKSDIVGELARRKPIRSLIQKEVGFKWKKKVCIGKIISSGKKCH